MGSASDSSEERENGRRPVACVVGRHDYPGAPDSLPGVLVRLWQGVALCNHQAAYGMLTGGGINILDASIPKCAPRRGARTIARCGAQSATRLVREIRQIAHAEGVQGIP